ncbi:uncharacterized protein [Zea mays]|uniref:uncharacterized protein isoform X1 n=1 Tax=Zea mays TaxID=4577 RepID=UPI0004DEC6D1|nr:uncharacterized protein LOC103630410 isoform X1 [Zea mays]|eukprot:XP_008649685.1 uncharacterized protein LOC103630410 isoform X1 [Zea mays]
MEGAYQFLKWWLNWRDLNHMIEWGVVQTKFKASMTIEEKSGPKEVKATLPKVWIQFTGIPNDMMEFLLIWAVGSILGVTKTVDMKFTNQYGICRLQVMVLDPLLIPQFIEVVIGECLFELQFRVEENMDGDSPVPVDMDDFSCGEDENKSDQLEDVVRGGNSLPPNNSAPDSGKSVSKGAGNDGNTGKKGAAHDVISSVVQYADLGLGMQGVDHAGNPTQAVVPATSSCMAVSVPCTPDVAAMAAVPEATMGLTESGRSKRRNRSGNGDSMQRASKLKAARNLDAVLSTGSF